MANNVNPNLGEPTLKKRADRLQMMGQGSPSGDVHTKKATEEILSLKKAQERQS